MATSNSVRSASSTEGGGSFSCSVGSSFGMRRNLGDKGGDIGGQPPPASLHALVAPHFFAMLSIFSFFFIRGREALETVVSTKEEVDWETWGRGLGTANRGCHRSVTSRWHPRLASRPERHLAHDLAAVKQHLVPFAEAVLRRPLRGDFWGGEGSATGTG